MATPAIEPILERLEVQTDPNDPRTQFGVIGAYCAERIPRLGGSIWDVEQAINEGSGNCFARMMAVDAFKLPGQHSFARIFVAQANSETYRRGVHFDAVLANSNFSDAARICLETYTAPQNISSRLANPTRSPKLWAEMARRFRQHIACLGGLSILGDHSNWSEPVIAEEPADYSRFSRLLRGLNIVASIELVLPMGAVHTALESEQTRQPVAADVIVLGIITGHLDNLAGAANVS